MLSVESRSGPVGYAPRPSAVLAATEVAGAAPTRGARSTVVPFLGDDGIRGPCGTSLSRTLVLRGRAAALALLIRSDVAAPARTSGEVGTGPFLLIEGNDEDYESLVRGLQGLGVRNCVYRFSHGEGAMQYLNHRGLFFKDGSAPRPEAVILNLCLPGMSGLEVLRAIRSNPELRTLPVVILNEPASWSDMSRCLNAGANMYVCKDPDPQTLSRRVQAAVQSCRVPQPVSQRRSCGALMQTQEDSK